MGKQCGGNRGPEVRFFRHRQARSDSWRQATQDLILVRLCLYLFRTLRNRSHEFFVKHNRQGFRKAQVFLKQRFSPFLYCSSCSFVNCVRLSRQILQNSLAKSSFQWSGRNLVPNNFSIRIDNEYGSGRLFVVEQIVSAVSLSYGMVFIRQNRKLGVAIVDAERGVFLVLDG